MNNRLFTTSVFGAGTSILVAIGGCSSNQNSANADAAGDAQMVSSVHKRTTNGQVLGIDRTAEAISSVRDLRTALSNERLQVDRTLSSLTAVMNSRGDLIPTFQPYIQALADLKTARQQTVSAADTMREKARGYITGWEVEVYGVEDPALRAQAEKRRDDVRQDYSGVTDNLRQVQSAYEKFETRAEDLRRFLANDLTSAGVEAAGPSSQQTVAAGGELKGRIDATVSNLDAVLGRMSPTGPSDRTASSPRTPDNAQPTGSSVQGVTPNGASEPNKP